MVLRVDKEKGYIDLSKRCGCGDEIQICGAVLGGKGVGWIRGVAARTTAVTLHNAAVLPQACVTGGRAEVRGAV